MSRKASFADAPPYMRRRLLRMGVIIVGGATVAALLIVSLWLAAIGDPAQGDVILMAGTIPILIAPIPYFWIAKLAAQVERANGELARLANTDELTGLANRRAALQQLAAWFDGGRSIALAIADVDHFKRINDRFGHDAGDAGLVHIAKTLKQVLPSDWLVARLGGEEFLVASVTASESDFIDTIKDVRQTLSAMPLITTAGPYSITASFGIAIRRHAESIDKLLNRADMALYEAKSKGRNRAIARV